MEAAGTSPIFPARHVNSYFSHLYASSIIINPTAGWLNSKLTQKEGYTINKTQTSIAVHLIGQQKHKGRNKSLTVWQLTCRQTTDSVLSLFSDNWARNPRTERLCGSLGPLHTSEKSLIQTPCKCRQCKMGSQAKV